MMEDISSNFKLIAKEYKENKFSETLKKICENHKAIPEKKTTAQSSYLLQAWNIWISREKPRGEALERDLEAAQQLLNLFYENRDSLHVKSIEWRRPIKTHCAEEEYKKAIYILGLSREESLKRKENYSKSIRERSKKRDIEKFRAKKIYEIIDSCAASENVYKKVIAVMLSCGSRIVEVLKVSTYNFTGNNGEVEVLGIAKCKDPHFTVIRPLIRLTYPRFAELVESIRSARDFATLTNAEATAAMDPEVNKVLFPLLGVTSHKLRYLYASLAHQLFAPNEPEQEYIRRMFGHSSNDVSLIYSYHKVFVAE